MQGLAAAEDGGERLNRHADDIVFRLLRGQGRSGGLRVEAQQKGTRVFGMETLAHDFRPQAARGAVLGDFLEQVVVRVEEKRELRRKFIDAESGAERGLDVSDAVGEGEGNFLD